LWGMMTTAQVKVDVEKKVNREANQRANSNTDKVIDKAIDKLEDGVGSLFKKKGKKDEAEKPAAQGKTATSNPQPETQSQNAPEEKPQPQLIWAKYDVVPGTEIIFEDNQEG